MTTCLLASVQNNIILSFWKMTVKQSEIRNNNILRYSMSRSTLRALMNLLDQNFSTLNDSIYKGTYEWTRTMPPPTCFIISAIFINTSHPNPAIGHMWIFNSRLLWLHDLMCEQAVNWVNAFLIFNAWKYLACLHYPNSKPQPQFLTNMKT